MATSVSKTIAYAGINFSGNITSTVSGNTVTVKYSVTAGSTYAKVKVWLRGDWWYLVSSVPWSGTKTLTKTLTIDGPTSFGVAMALYNPDTDDWYANVIGSTQLSQTPKSYTISYNANGGSGAPSSQTKYHGSAITLSSTKPTRTGYRFSKWNTKSGGSGTSYNSGASYTANANATLYAQWTANKYTVTFDANGGSGGPGTATKTYGTAMTIPSTKPTKTNYNFLGWAESKTATKAQYLAGGSYTKAITANTTLYAVWELAYYTPVVSGVNVSRCDQDGNVNDYGTYILVGFSWECCQLISNNPVTSIKIKYKTPTDTKYTEVAIEPNGTTTGTQLVGIGGSLSTDSTYEVVIAVTDTEGGVGTATKIASVAAFPIDVLRGGKGVAIGKAATKEGFHVAMSNHFDKGVESGLGFYHKKDNRIDGTIGVTPPDATYNFGGRYCYDSNNHAVGYSETYMLSSGRINTSLTTKRYLEDGTERGNGIYLGIDNDGTCVVNFYGNGDGSNATAWRNALGASIVVRCGSSFTIGTELAKVPMSLYSEIDTTSKLSVYNGGVKCANDGHVRVTARYRASNIASKAYTHARIYKNSSAAIWYGYGFNHNSSAWYANGMIDGIIEVSAGDVIYFYIDVTSGSGTLRADSGNSMLVTYI